MAGRKVKAKPKPGCIRTGLCCEFVLLSFSPADLRRSYHAWEKGKEQIIKLNDIHLIFPMLEGRCRGKWINSSSDARYVYGPCRNFERDKKGVGACGIWKDRPALCSGYPYYQKPRTVQMGATSPPENPGYMRGCGFNSNPAFGSSPSDFKPSKLVALDANEK